MGARKHGIGATATTPVGAAAATRSGGEVVPGFGAKANITVTIDLEDLKAATANAIGQTVYSNGLSAATIRRLACDANVIPIVLGSQSEPLDVGRRERLVTKAIRRALNTRDRGCVVCAAPPVMCDAHHLISWIDGGPTALTNLVLLCRRHHTDLHAGHWNITITSDVVHVARPAWADPPSPSSVRPPAEDVREDQRFGFSKSGDDPAYASEVPEPAGDPARPDPPSVSRHEQSARVELSGAGSARRDHPGDRRTGADGPGPRTASRAEPWGKTILPAGSRAGVRSSRWRSDDAKLAEAARFAVWGADTTTETDAGPPPFAMI
ncbi:HNH endonuclease signature motif containing protein [Kribbella aluminosa]|uniref:HNH endonuclease signature motif containing protein n=1 Tax=Kribbella aluminosa TaxID=416017 RepID=UPI0031D388CE